MFVIKHTCYNLDHILTPHGTYYVSYIWYLGGIQLPLKINERPTLSYIKLPYFVWNRLFFSGSMSTISTAQCSHWTWSILSIKPGGAKIPVKLINKCDVWPSSISYCHSQTIPNFLYHFTMIITSPLKIEKSGSDENICAMLKRIFDNVCCLYSLHWYLEQHFLLKIRNGIQSIYIRGNRF